MEREARDYRDVRSGGTLAGGASAQGREADAREPRNWPVYRRSGNGEAEGLWNVMEVGCMAVLDNSKHEHFALLVAKGVSASKAYVSVGYSVKGSAPSASRLLTNAKVCARIRELQETLSAGTIALSSRNARLQALQNRWDRMRRVIDERAASPDFARGAGRDHWTACEGLQGQGRGHASLQG